jgi:hypothetical protein
MRNYLVNKKNDGEFPPERLLEKLKTFYNPFRGFHEQGEDVIKENHWRTNNGEPNKHLAVGVTREIANTSLARLLAVKNFEFMNEFNLQDQANFYAKPEDQPSERQWPSQKYSVFEIPAHFTSKNSKNFETQPIETGRFETTNWYTLQFVLNGGNGFVGGTTPTDFNYHAQHIAYASADAGGINESLRYFSTISQSYQIRSWSGSKYHGPGENGFKIETTRAMAFCRNSSRRRFLF